MMNRKRVPSLVSRQYGAGFVIVAQLGTAQVPAGGLGPAEPPVGAPPEWLRKLVENLASWSAK
jgi:hypothetical protein